MCNSGFLSMKTSNHEHTRSQNQHQYFTAKVVANFYLSREKNKEGKWHFEKENKKKITNKTTILRFVSL